MSLQPDDGCIDQANLNFDLQTLERALQRQASIWTASLSDQDRSRFSSPAVPLFPSFNVHLFEQVSSTNTVVWDLFQQGAEAGIVAIALTQKAGRGQRGHQWQSARGGLYLSLGLMLDLPIDQAGQLTLSSAWGIATAIRHHGIPVEIKWFNDLVVGGRKLGGILTETRSCHGRIQRAVIGVGINWSNPVPSVGINLKTILAQLQSDAIADSASSPQPLQPSIASLETLAAVVLQGLRGGYCYWQQHGSHRLVAAYEALLVNIGETVAIDTQPGTITGITPDGKLRVQLCHATATERYLEPGAICLGYHSCRGSAPLGF